MRDDVNSYITDFGSCICIEILKYLIIELIIIVTW